MTEETWERPAAGREPAGAALLAWLADPDAPRLCVVTGSEGCGKSALVAWLVGHGSRPGTRSERRVHGFVPLAGQSATTAAWTLAEQLSLAARTPGELVSKLGDDARRTVLVLPDLHDAKGPEAVSEFVTHLLRLAHIRIVVEVRTGHPEAGLLSALKPAVMDLDDAQWTDAARYAAWREARSPTSTTRAAQTERQSPATVDLNDAAALCTSDPWEISRRFEESEEEHGGLRSAWLRVGPSLTRDLPPADRALTLLSGLGDDADPRLPDQLRSLATGSAWRMVWRRVRGDVRPPWPGPARAMVVGHSALSGTLVVADHQGTVRVLDLHDGASRGRLPTFPGGARSVSTCSDGTVIALNDLGAALHAQSSYATPKPTGIAALLNNGPRPLEALLETANGLRQERHGTVVASSTTMLAVADNRGSVHAHALDGAEERHLTTRLHDGSVTALAVLEAPIADGRHAPLVYSGGADGHVRVWQPGADPLTAPITSRNCPVTALAAVDVVDSGPVLAIGWADGTAEYVFLESGTVRAFRPGPPVQSVALTREGHLAVGTDETLVCLQPS